MKVCVSSRQQAEYMRKADEIRVASRDHRIIPDLAEKYPEDFGKDQWDFDADEYFSHGFDNGRKDDLFALNIGEKRYYGSYYEIKKYMDSLDRQAFAPYRQRA